MDKQSKSNSSQKSLLTKEPNPLPENKRKPFDSDLFWRISIAGFLAALSVILSFVFHRRAVDPLDGWIVVEPLAGAILFWPLSRIFIRITSRITGILIALIPVVSLLLIRSYGGERDIHFGASPNLSFGAIVFFSICSLAAYLLFRTPPSRMP